MHLIDYTEADTYGRVFWVGVLNTLLVSFIGIILATIIGLIVGLARLSPNWLISRLAGVYVETLRNIPLLLQIFFWYFAVLRSLPSVRDSIVLSEGSLYLNNRGLFAPSAIYEPAFWAVVIAVALSLVGWILLARWARIRREQTGQRFPVFWTGLVALILVPTLVFFIAGSPLSFDYPIAGRFNFKGGMVIVPEFLALLVALSLYTATFIAEVIRSGVMAVSHGQTEAARSLGLSTGQTTRLIILPQALRVIIPPLTNQYLNLAKNSSLGAAIAYPELINVFAGTTLNQTGQAIEAIAMTMAVYLSISLSISMFMNWYNGYVSLKER